ncbi:MAG: Stf0 family sulfotransferase [Planctomycetota bacterium]
MIPKQCYFICATPRSGSTLLCEALRLTGLAGRPDEYFGPMHVERWNKQWHTSTAGDYLERVFETGTGANGVWGAKLMRVYWHDFIGQLRGLDGPGEESDESLVQRVFQRPRYLFITRRDKVRQAVSWLKFLQGSAWYWEGETPQKIEGLEYQEDVIDRFIDQVNAHESAWMRYFERVGVEPFVVVYEDFCAAYESTAAAALEYLGLNHGLLNLENQRRMKQQSDQISEQWVQRYRASKK